MIFLKHFDIANQKLTGVGKVYVPRASKVTFTQSEIQDGDVICFQVDMNEKE